MTMTGLERELFLFRTREPFDSMSEVDLLTHQQMAPMLVAEVGAGRTRAGRFKLVG